MNEQKNNAPEQAKPEKKLSRTTLTFYIVGLLRRRVRTDRSKTSAHS